MESGSISTKERNREKNQYRAFLAVPLADYFLEDIQCCISNLKGRIDGVKWVKPEQAHVTLHFFGNISDEEFEKIIAIVKPIVASFSPISLALAEMGFFPNAKSPKIIWIGLAGEVDKLANLQKTIEEELGKAGFPIEERSFRPHATLARARRRVKVWVDPSLNLEGPSRLDLKAIEEILLYQSHLTPEGPMYEPLQKINFS